MRTYEPFPELVNVALDLSTVVADEQHAIYREFLGTTTNVGMQAAGKLPLYLEKVRRAYLLGMQLGVVVTRTHTHTHASGTGTGQGVTECFAGVEGRGEMRRSVAV